MNSRRLIWPPMQQWRCEILPVLSAHRSGLFASQRTGVRDDGYGSRRGMSSARQACLNYTIDRRTWACGQRNCWVPTKDSCNATRNRWRAPHSITSSARASRADGTFICGLRIRRRSRLGQWV